MSYLTCINYNCINFTHAEEDNYFYIMQFLIFSSLRGRTLEVKSPFMSLFIHVASSNGIRCYSSTHTQAHEFVFANRSIKIFVSKTKHGVVN